jgi:hypothetical protein
MNDEQPKKFTVKARTGIKGEAFFEELIVDYSLPHRIAGAKDLGIDYICEWINGDKPTGILYAVQVKTFSNKTAKPEKIGVEKLNGLEKYTISNPNLNIDNRTLRYWKGLGMPVYLFAVVKTEATAEQKEELICYYKRFTSCLTSAAQQENLRFFKVNHGSKFIAYQLEQERKLGFARDLFIDYMRWVYYRGSINYLNPRTLGLNQFPEKDAVFEDIIREYEQKVLEAYVRIREFLRTRSGFLEEESS